MFQSFNVSKVAQLANFKIGCKGTTKFADVQILGRKSSKSFNSSKGDGVPPTV